MAKNKKMGLVSYPVGDFLVRVKNASLARQKRVVVAKTNLIENVAKALKRAGFLDSVSTKEGKVEVELTFRSKRPLLLNLKLVSKPGLKIYMGVADLEGHKEPSVLIVSTPQGVLTLDEALKKRVGGEVMAEVW